MAKRAHNRPKIREKDGIKLLIDQLGSTTIALLVNATDAIGVMAEDPESIDSIIKYDGIRLLWSLLKNPAWQVRFLFSTLLYHCHLYVLPRTEQNKVGKHQKITPL